MICVVRCVLVYVLMAGGFPSDGRAEATVGEVGVLRWPLFHEVEGDRVGEVRLFGLGNTRLDWNGFLLPVRAPRVARIEVELHLDDGAAIDLSAPSARWSEITAFVSRAGNPELDLVVHWHGPMQQMLDGGRCVVPAGTTLRVLVDLQDYFCGFPDFDVSPSSGMIEVEVAPGPNNNNGLGFLALRRRRSA